ncbi:MAG: UDP-N-acetylmuramate dehydrogenase [Ruminiclostridium sp.]|nr:UDP-N-acetylmuramate dehydrogenase [Ruminiclostridium sp.]
MNYSEIDRICEKYGVEILRDEPLSEYTSFQIGGKCDILVKPDNVDCMREILECCRKNDIKYYILGKGSNVLVSDNGFRGVVIVISSAFSDVRLEDDECIYCEAGASLAKVCAFAKEHSLTGLEFAYGIPGSVGGALFMNAGAYGGEMKDVAESCDYLNENLEIKNMTAEEMMLSYRHSVFSENSYVILGVRFRLCKGDKAEITAKMSELMEKRRSKQPLEYPSAGSTFKRPEGDFAARLIEVSGLKGFTCGGAQVSEKHSGFVINRGGATFNDVMKVIDAVKEKVYADSGVMLEREIEILE